MNNKPDIAQIKDLFSGHEAKYVHPWQGGRSAVLLPLIEDKDGVSILFEVRSAGIVQGGQVCFPGGMVEEGESPLEAAFREAEEELCLEKGQVSLVSPLYIMNGPRGTEVHSFAGILSGYSGTFAQDEVARVFQIPLGWFLANPPREGRTEWGLRGTEEDFPYELIPGGREYKFGLLHGKYLFYETEEAVIWGLTASIVNQFVRELEL